MNNVSTTDPRPASEDLNAAANNVIGVTNSVGAIAADVQNTTQALRFLRAGLSASARHPGRLAAAGFGLILSAGVLAWSQEQSD